MRILGQEATIDLMARLKIADLLADAPVDPEAHLDATRVERYAETLEALPPDLACGFWVCGGRPDAISWNR